LLVKAAFRDAGAEEPMHQEWKKWVSS